MAWAYLMSYFNVKRAKQLYPELGRGTMLVHHISNLQKLSDHQTRWKWVYISWPPHVGMNACESVYMRVYIHVYACMHVYVCAHISAWVWECVSACVDVCISLHVCRNGYRYTSLSSPVNFRCLPLTFSTLRQSLLLNPGLILSDV